MKIKLCDPPNCKEQAYVCRGCGAAGCDHKMRKACSCADGPDEELLYEENAHGAASDNQAKLPEKRILPIGTKIISLANEDKIGTVVSESVTRGIPEYTVRWSDGGTSIFFADHDIKNTIKQHGMTVQEIVDLYENLPPEVGSDSPLTSYERPCSDGANKIGKCVLNFEFNEDREHCIYCGSRITPASDI